MADKGPKLKISAFEPHGDRLDLGKRWEKWVSRFERDLKYNGVDPKEKAEVAKMALLIYAGTEVEDIHDSLADVDKPGTVAAKDWTEYQKSLEKLNQHFVPQKSNDFALFELLNIKPESEEWTKNYAARLRNAANKCDFSNWSADKMIKCLVITNMRDEDLKLECLQKDHTLGEVLDKAQKKEDALEMNRKIDQDQVVKRVEDRKTTKKRHEASSSKVDRRHDRGDSGSSRQSWEGKQGSQYQKTPQADSGSSSRHRGRES